MTVSDNRKGYDKILEQIDLLENSYVLVGFQEGTVTKAQYKEKVRKEPGQSMAQIAAENEFGTRQIPARPFMRTSFDENRRQIDTSISTEYEKIIDGKSTTKKSLGLIG